jgi:hypothetical protein
VIKETKEGTEGYGVQFTAGLSGTVPTGSKRGEGASADFWKMRLPGKGNSKCKDAEEEDV